MPEPSTSALRAVSDAVLAVASRLAVDDVLQGLVDEARVLGGARYAALGIPDGAGGFSRFLVAGMSDELIAAMGPLPRTHGMLGAMLVAPGPYRTDDIHTHPRFKGWWPREHPDMRSFLGVPIVAEGEVIGALYLTEKQGAERFSDTDQEVIELLAAHAAIAITNARLYEHSRELSVLSERNRLALELHDVVSQKLFALVLGAEAAATTLDRDPAATRVQLERLQSLSREALDELRSLVLELRPPDLDRDGLCGTLTKHVELVRRLHGAHVDLDARRGRDGRPRPRPRGAAGGPGGPAQCAAPRRRAARARVDARHRRRAGPRGRRRRDRLRPRRRRAALAPSRPHVDGGARPAPRRPAAHRPHARRRRDRPPGGAAWLTRSGC